MKKILLLAIACLLQAEDLKSLLEYAHKNNERIRSKSLLSDAKQSEIKSSENSYYPTIDLGALYQRFDDPNPFSPRASYSAYATLGIDIYDGGKRSNTVQQKKEELLSAKYEYDAIKKSTSLLIVEDFFNSKILQAKLRSHREASNAVRAQLARMQRFYDAALATSDDVSRLQAAYDNNIYTIESIKFELLRIKKSLELKVGKTIETLDDAQFLKNDEVNIDPLDAIEALKYEKNAILHASEIVDAHFYPQIRLEDTFSFYGYDAIPAFGEMPLSLPKNQNQLMATVNMRLFDFGSIHEAKEAYRLSATSLDAEIAYQSKEQEMLQELARSRITTVKLSIQSAKSAFTSAKSTYESITKKYNNGIVDNIVYLDALTTYTEAQATYEESLYNLELAYALHYYYNSQKLEEFLQ